ncbi:MAG: hydantoinase/oxoprolinase family protein [Deltaproteobacteria bacterium]
MQALGLDIGGANLKAATSGGAACSEPFEMWRAPGELAVRLQKLISRFPPADVLAVTMTAELADCFATKAEGVAAILAAVQEAAGPAPAVVWQTTGEFAPPTDAVCRPIAVAAANWHALATWAGRLAPQGKALLFDIGSTTSDIIPLHDGRPVARGLTDLDRLLNHELVYTGLRRTPLCAVAESVTVRGRPCRVAAELFATMLDVHLLMGVIPEDCADRHTADGRPATIACAHARLARMVCCDRDEIDLAEARSIARGFAEAQKSALCSAIGTVVGRHRERLETVIVAGSGEILARKILAEHPATMGSRIVRLAESLSPDLAESACAYAVAVLATERRQGRSCSRQRIQPGQGVTQYQANGNDNSRMEDG